MKILVKKLLEYINIISILRKFALVGTSIQFVPPSPNLKFLISNYLNFYNTVCNLLLKYKFPKIEQLDICFVEKLKNSRSV